MITIFHLGFTGTVIWHQYSDDVCRNWTNVFRLSQNIFDLVTNHGNTKYHIGEQTKTDVSIKFAIIEINRYMGNVHVSHMIQHLYAY